MSDYDATKLLIADSPIAFLPKLACIVGTDEAIFLQQVHYWLNNPWDRRIEVKEHEGRDWVRIPPKALFDEQEGRLRFLPQRTFRRVVSRLRDNYKVLLTANLNHSDRDVTNWYAIDYKQLKSLENKGSDGLRQNGTKVSAKMAQSDSADVAQSRASKRRKGSDKVASYNNKDVVLKVPELNNNNVVDVASPVVVPSLNLSFDEIAEALFEIGVRPLRVCQDLSEIPGAAQQIAWWPHREGEVKEHGPGTLRKAIENNWGPPRSVREVERDQERRAKEHEAATARLNARRVAQTKAAKDAYKNATQVDKSKIDLQAQLLYEEGKGTEEECRILATKFFYHL